ncbi:MULTISPECIES: 6-carboxytetrahydropterin synthase QueD [Gallibacterium]|uniref:6-carboxy-5,6,7,8-tetrahydropterin synthase n=2 Tax=Gallibacterium TaxID=155493 RepID=A0A0A2YN88_9PAST|nr:MULTISPECIES: 6-carboxytetrahydropterin synthase QueD [Gallibacterium]KGQ25366.1 6-carboxy-5,6,7,8-tetrahydropterin synthase [Gallibacterium anatis CCM5995]KGQ31307.1 6-carboxy-5,6,7,8-tetrahydropterin synthase [Gallibacterium anatis]KGQ38809.1 6-carboxy-5,6,7,8-tetrahydropterin synthase [Gallibacterium anatis]MDK9431119.1 6-carboxytetrahydropterin synthase QueD [Gallibacterium anatis]OBW97670.1 6-carboxy-5,6,7,8-tetrahydropterin synthase [Gallibacterium genomosp. 1]
MLKVAKEFSFDMAHLLDGHDGKCQNLHGHTYKLQVIVSGETENNGAKKGMVIDFADLKRAVNELIISPMDHAFIYDQSSERETKIAQLLQQLNSKTFALPVRSTAENLAQFIFQRLQENVGFHLHSIRLWETPTSFAEYGEA